MSRGCVWGVCVSSRVFLEFFVQVGVPGGVCPGGIHLPGPEADHPGYRQTSPP